MSLQSALRSRITDAATAAGFASVGATTPREMEGVALPALYTRLFKITRYKTSPGTGAQQIEADVEVLVFSPEGGRSEYAGAEGAAAAHDLALEAFGAARVEPVRSVQYAGPTGGRDLFVTAFVVKGYADVFNDS